MSRAILRPYQAQLKAEILEAWQTKKNVLAVLPTGGGKTVLFSEIIHDHRGASVAIAHRQELVSQISLALARDEVRHRIIGPPSVVKMCVNDHMEELGRSYYDPRAQAGVAGVDTLIRRGTELSAWANSVGLWVQDECFPAGTLIDGVPIETLCIGDTVTAFNEATGGFEKRKIVRTFKNGAPKHMVRLLTKGHHVLHCTQGHPFWTKRGWVAAGDLQLTDEVFGYEMYELRESHIVNDGISTLPIQKKWSYFLSTFVRLRASRRKQDAASEIARNDARGLHDLWKTRGFKWASVASIPKNRARILLDSVFKHLSRTSIIRNNVKNESEIRFRKNDSQQPHGAGGVEVKNASYIKEDRTPAEGSWGERARTYFARTDFIHAFFGIWFCNATRHKNKSVSRKCRACSAVLQTRSWALGVKNCIGGGRRIPSRATTSGCEKRCVSEWVGLDSIEVYERNNIDQPGNGCDDGFVYNIEVEELHTYVANGIVVHNCHHVLRDNKWGKAADMFPNARGLGVTATPLRADGKGLGRHVDGLFDDMVEGPSMRDLINMGFLTEYRVFAPKSDLDRASIPVSDATGDFSPVKMRAAVRKSQILGDVVKHYLRIAPNKLGVTFAPDVETATDIAQQFNLAGVPAAVVSAKTPDAERKAILRKFRRRELLQVVNVDLFGEGFDLPAIEVVSMARPTQSYGLFVQQFGRSLRLLDGKQFAIIIDHVGNVEAHGLPDAPRLWSLDRRERRKASAPDDAIPVKACPTCTAVYERVYTSCPFCGFQPVPAARSGPEFVDGDLLELDPDTLARMRGEVARVDMDKEEYRLELASKHTPKIGQLAHVKRHAFRQEAQSVLRAAIALWAGYQRALGRPDSESYRRFYFMFGLDVLTAQALGTQDALSLADKINQKIVDLSVNTQ